MSSSSSGSSGSNGEQHQQPIPVLAPADVQHAISLIQAAYAPSAATDLPQLQSLQSALLAMQRTPAAWGLVVPLLAHEDANVQFFGAHTAHAKIARGDLGGLPPQERLALRDALVGLAGVPRARVVRRKLYGALTALAIRLVPGPGGSGSGQWEGWVEGIVASFVGAGAPSAHIHEFLAGAAEDVGSANMLPQPKIQLEASLRAAAPLVLQSITAVLTAPPSAASATDSDALPAALACLVAWLPNRLLPDADVARLVPLLISLLGSPSAANAYSSNPSSQSSQNSGSSQSHNGNEAGNEAAAQAASTALSELLARPPSGWSPAVLLEPLLVWAYTAFPEFSAPSSASAASSSSYPNLASSSASPWGSASTNWLTPNYTLPPLPPQRNTVLRRHAKLLVALAEAGVEWVAGCVVDPTSVPSSSSSASSAYSGGASSSQGSQGQGSGWGQAQGGRGEGEGQGGIPRALLAQTLLRLVLALTAGDVGGARVRLAPSPSSQSGGSGHGLGFGASQGSAEYVVMDAQSRQEGGREGPDGEDEEEEEEDEDENGAGAGAPLGFWFLLQEALWEVKAANPHLFPSPTSSSSQSQSQTYPLGSFPPGTPQATSPAQYDMDDDDPESVRGRGGAGGTPWTPGVVRTGSYAFGGPSGGGSPAMSPTFALGGGGSGGGGGGGMGSPPAFRSASSFGFPSGGNPFAPDAARYGNDNGDRGEGDEGDDGEGGGGGAAEKARMVHARAAYVALVRILRAKVVCGRGLGRDRLERFAVYRRDVGDTLVNAYYILRDDLLVYLVGEAAAGLEGGRAWETIEAPLHCLRAIHEALDLESTSTSTSPDADAGVRALGRLFGAGVWGRLPSGAGGQGGKGEALAVARLRRTALGLVDTYAAYFTTRSPDALLAPLQYVLGALADPDPGICLQVRFRFSSLCSGTEISFFVSGFRASKASGEAASSAFPHVFAALALRSLCDANRRALASRIGAFAEVHAGLGGIPDSEKGKVLQSIASVIQALPPAEGIAPIEAMVGPILQRLSAAIGAVGAQPEAARLAAILQLEILAGVAKGLTRTADPSAFDEDDSGGAEAEAVRAAREDPRTGAMRAALFDAIAQVAELWSADAEVGQALSELFKAITALPADVTLLSLPAAPLLGVVCRAAGRQLTGVWLALATILIAQLNPPPLILTLKSGPTEEAEAAVRQAVGGLVTSALSVLGAPGGMVENPDIVQEFFACMDRVAQDFTAAFCALPDGAFDALMQCAISALALQERYSLVAACTFLGTLVHRTALYAPISPEQLQLLQAHTIRTHGRAIMRAVLCGFAGAAPRSVVANLLELLGALVSRWDERAVAEAEGDMRQGEGRQLGSGARGWVAGVVFADDFFPSKAGQEAKERFVKTVVSSRSVKKTKEAANQFTLIAWGLEGSTFGYSSV
ncbi:hypothetical protein DFH06DRAFT_1474761 [Mycena polygramma]|nr:hypothetical protein DFH06DRAFT_1474761 [Mycena polygramma]